MSQFPAEPRWLSPAVVYFAIAAFICGALLIALYDATVYQETSKQLAFLAAHGEQDSYLVPVNCGLMPRGEPEQDYLRGSSPPMNHRSKEVCWYSPSTYDRLFAGKYPETGRAAHVAQAKEMGVDLLKPNLSRVISTGISLLVFAGLGAAVLFRWRRFSTS